MEKLTVQGLIDKFNLKILYVNKAIALQLREIKVLGINRGGLELSGFKTKHVSRKRRIIVLSSKEKEYLENLPYNNYEAQIINLFEPHVPLIIVTSNFIYIEELIKISKKYKSEVPIVYFNGGTAGLHSTVEIYIAERLAARELVHGTLVNIYGYGVLITGESGIGKSETTLDLIRSGHLFIADDSISLIRINNKIVGKPSDIVKNMIEIRGIGILDVTKMYGYHIIMHETAINLVVNLVKATTNIWTKIDRLGLQNHYREFFNLPLPLITIPVTSGRNIADLIASAVINTKLKDEGQDAAVEFEANVIKSLKQKK